MRWLDDVSMDLRKMGVNEWRDRARNRETWRHIVEEAKAHPGLLRHLEGRSQVVPRGQTDRHDEANSRFPQFCDSA